jgi:protein required for attachment to host cells
MRQTTAEVPQENPAYGADNRKGNLYNTQPANTTMRQTTAETAQEQHAYGADNRRGNLFNTQPANSTLKQNTIDVPQTNPAYGADNQRGNLFNKQPANATLRQEVNYNDHLNGTHTVVEEHRSRSDVNAMTTHSHKEETTVGRTFTYSGWHAGVNKETIGEQNSKERDKYLNYTRVNPPNSSSRNVGVQDMGVGSSLDDRIVMKLNKLKQMPFQNDRIEKSVAEVLQNNQLINNALQKYKEPGLAY